MRVTSHTELLDEHSQDGTCSCGEHHSHATVQLTQTLVGLVLTFNSFLYTWLVEADRGVASFSALVGALLLGFPIVRVSMKDLRRGPEPIIQFLRRLGRGIIHLTLRLLEFQFHLGRHCTMGDRLARVPRL